MPPLVVAGSIKEVAEVMRWDGRCYGPLKGTISLNTSRRTP